MSSGLSIYGVERVSPLVAFRAANFFFECIACPITGGGYNQRSMVAGVDDIELVEGTSEQLLAAIDAGVATDFRLYSESNNIQPWFASFGYSTEKFGSFFCIDAQVDLSLESSKDLFIDAMNKMIAIFDFTYAIIYEAKNNSDAMWYARGENFKTIYSSENPIAFSKSAPGLYEGEREYESHKLRMIYPVNFLNHKHLSIIIEGLPLNEWIATDERHGKIEKTREKWCSTVGANEIVEINEIFGNSGLLLGWNKLKAKNKILP